MNRFDVALSIGSLSKEVKGAAFKNAVAKIPTDFLELTVSQLEKIFKPTELERVIKNSFWDEYLRAKMLDSKMDLKRVYGPNCTYTHWYVNILGNPIKLLWILAPMNDLKPEILKLKHSILEGAREILDLPICDENGSFNYKVMDAKYNLFKTLLDLDESCRYNSGAA